MQRTSATQTLVRRHDVVSEQCQDIECGARNLRREMIIERINTPPIPCTKRAGVNPCSHDYAARVSDTAANADSRSKDRSCTETVNKRAALRPTT